MLIIGGAALGAVIAGNSLHELKAIGGGFGKVFKGPRHSKQDHIDAIVLCTRLMKILRSDGPVALESHVADTVQLADLRRISQDHRQQAACQPDLRHAHADRGVLRHISRFTPSKT